MPAVVVFFCKKCKCRLYGRIGLCANCVKEDEK